LDSATETFFFLIATAVFDAEGLLSKLLSS
jgi:hypothetical protein